jgi:cell division septation protein DedD
MAESETDELQDTEITLSTGKLLGIFFGLVLLCSVFFTMGYMFGRSNEAKGKTDIVGSETSGGSTTGKPSAQNKSGDNGSSANAANTQSARVQPSASPTPAAAATLVPASSTAPASDAQANAPATAIYFQVAAVSKKEDADLLVSALSKKQYPVFVTGSQGDALFHVQVGPFTDPKDAEAMRSRLAGDGYNAIVKK